MEDLKDPKQTYRNKNYSVWERKSLKEVNWFCITEDNISKFSDKNSAKKKKLGKNKTNNRNIYTCGLTLQVAHYIYN